MPILKEATELWSEKQELLATLMEGTMSMQRVAPEKYQEKIFEELNELEEQKTKEALELLGRKHKFVKLDNELARMIQEMELSGTVGDFSGALDNSSLHSCSPSAAQETDDAVSESSWTALAKKKERYWWNVDLEGEKEKLEVVGLLFMTEGGSLDPKGKMCHWSARIKITKEESEEPKGAGNEKQKKEMEVDEATLQEASVEIKVQKEK